MEFTVRAANVEDCKDIARMMAELREHQKPPRKMEIAQEDLERDGFGAEPLFHGIIAEVPEHLGTKDGHTAVGYAIYFYSYSSMTGRAVYLENSYVMPEFSGDGVGEALMSKVAQLGLAAGCSRLMFAAHSQRPSWELRPRRGCSDVTVEPGYLLMRCEGEALEKLANEPRLTLTHE